MIFLKKYQHLITVLLLSLFISLIYLYRLIPSYNYDSDFGRDINDILKITQGHLTLIGPKLSFGGIFSGPYYYYLFAPILKIFSLNPKSIIYANAFIYILFFVGYCLAVIKHKLKNKYLLILSAFWIFTSPYMIFSGRGPGNAFSYFPLSFILIMFFPILWEHYQNNKIINLFYGLLIGIIINFHLVNLLIFGPLLFISFVACIFKKDKIRIIQLILISVGFILAFSPMFLFEIKHNFIQFKNTFIDKSYLSFTNNQNLSNPLPTSSNIFINFWLLQKHFTQWVQIPFVILYLSTITLFFLKKKKISTSAKIISFSSILSFLLLVIIAKSQVAIHYFFPFILSIQISLTLLLSSFPTRISSKLLIILILINIIRFPQQFYQPAVRNLNEYQNFTQKIINSNILQRNENISLFCARETTSAVLGWEYRYFLKTNNYTLAEPTLFNQSQQLLIIQEKTNNEDVSKIKSWELDQFGPKKLNKMIEIDNRKIYLFDKLSN